MPDRDKRPVRSAVMSFGREARPDSERILIVRYKKSSTADREERLVRPWKDWADSRRRGL